MKVQKTTEQKLRWNDGISDRKAYIIRAFRSFTLLRDTNMTLIFYAFTSFTHILIHVRRC